jgi:hypothetical protein
MSDFEDTQLSKFRVIQLHFDEEDNPVRVGLHSNFFKNALHQKVSAVVLEGDLTAEERTALAKLLNDIALRVEKDLRSKF